MSGVSTPSPRLSRTMIFTVWQNYAAAAEARLLIAEAIETVGELNRIREAVPGAQIVVCRLRAPLETMRRRVSQREPGMLREALVSRVTELDQVMDAAALEHFSVATEDDRTVTEAAVEMLALANWIP